MSRVLPNYWHQSFDIGHITSKGDCFAFLHDRWSKAETTKCMLPTSHSLTQPSRTFCGRLIHDAGGSGGACSSRLTLSWTQSLTGASLTRPATAPGKLRQDFGVLAGTGCLLRRTQKRCSSDGVIGVRDCTVWDCCLCGRVGACIVRPPGHIMLHSYSQIGDLTLLLPAWGQEPGAWHNVVWMNPYY